MKHNAMITGLLALGLTLLSVTGSVYADEEGEGGTAKDTIDSICDTEGEGDIFWESGDTFGCNWGGGGGAGVTCTAGEGGAVCCATSGPGDSNASCWPEDDWQIATPDRVKGLEAKLKAHRAASKSTTVPGPRTEVKFGAKVDSGKALSLPGADNKDEVQLPVTGIVPRTDPFSKAKTKPGATGGFKVIPGLPTPGAKTKIKRPVATDSTKVKDKVKTTPPAADKSQPVKVVQPSQPVVIKKPKKAEADVPEPQPLQPDTPTAMPAPAELAPAPTIKLKKMKKSE